MPTCLGQIRPVAEKETTDREHELAAKLDATHQRPGRAEGLLDEAIQNQARQIHRHAQFYWDCVMVENSGGALAVQPQETSTSARTG